MLDGVPAKVLLDSTHHYAEARHQFNEHGIFIATGSKPSNIPGVEIGKCRIITSTGASAIQEKPKSMIITGDGVIGVEMASIFNHIGAG